MAPAVTDFGRLLAGVPPGAWVALSHEEDRVVAFAAEMKEAVAKTIVETGGKADKDQHFDELIKGLQKAEEKLHKEGKPLYQALRKHMPIYG